MTYPPNVDVFGNAGNAEVISNSVFLGVEVEMSIASGGERNPTLQAGLWQSQNA